MNDSHVDEDRLLKALAEDHRVNPGLSMSWEDLEDYFDVKDDELDKLLIYLEQKKLVKLYRGKRGVQLAKATKSYGALLRPDKALDREVVNMGYYAHRCTQGGQ